MTPVSAQTEILRQLADIQRQLGSTTALVETIREDIRTQTVESSNHRQHVGSMVDNIVVRVGQLENELRAIKQVVEKTVKPLALGYTNWRQRAIGFAAAISIVGMAGTGLYWVATTGLPWVVKYVQAKGP